MVIIFRMVERILGVLIGGVLIYFGYRLFLVWPASADATAAQANFHLPAETSSSLAR